MLFKKQAVHDAWAATDRTLDFKIVIKDKTYTATDITNLTFDSGAMNGAALTIGSTYQNTIKITFSHLIEGLELLDEVTPQIGIRLPDGTWDFTNLGVFVLDSEVVQDRNNNTTTLSASDRMCMLGGTYESKLTYPAPISDIAIEAANLSGVKINEADFARIPNTEINSFGSVTYRDAIGYIAQFAGGFATFDRDGLLDVRTLSDPNFVISPEQYQSKGLSKNESFYRIGGITCTVTTIVKDESGNETQETKMLQAGSSSGTQITLINPSMTQVLLDELYQQLQDINFYPFALNWFGDPSLEVGDWITIKDITGNEFKTPNLLYSLTFGGGLSAVSKADTTVASSASFVYKGQLSQDVENIRQHMNASGNIVSEGIDPPSNPKPGDIWFAKDGPDTIIKTWVIDPETGIGSWQEQVSTKPDEKLQESVDNAVKDAADALDKSNTAVENSNKAVEDAGFANDTANDAKSSAADAIGQANEAKNNADNALKNSSDALADAANAINTANNSDAKASQAQKDANAATGKAEDAISVANKAQGDATSALGNSNAAISNAQDALNAANDAKQKAQDSIDKYESLGMSPAWSWSSDGSDRFMTNYPSENLITNSVLGVWSNITSVVSGKYTITEQKSAGVRIVGAYKLLKPAIVYAFSFKIKKTGGLITGLGGHSALFKTGTISVYEDGAKKASTWDSANITIDDDKEHQFVIIASLADVEPSDNSLYIQPGRNANYSSTYSAEIWDIKIGRDTGDYTYTSSPEDDRDNAIPSYVGFAVEPSDNPTDYSFVRNPDKIDGDIQVQISNINGELSQKVSQTDYDNLQGTVTSQGTQITQTVNDLKSKADKTVVDTINQTVNQQGTEIAQNSHDIQLKADSSTVNEIKGTVDSNSAAIKLANDQIDLKADQSQVDTINNTVQQNTANIGVNANAIKLKADSSTVDGLAGRVTKAEGELTVQADKIAQTVSKTEMNDKLSDYATQTWTQGQIKTTADNINLSVQKVQSDLDNLNVGGRNYWIESTSIPGYLSINNDGSVLAPDANQLLSDFILVSPGQQLEYQTWIMIPASARAWDNYQFFDFNKKPVGSRYVQAGDHVASNTQTHRVVDIVVPDNANYIRIGSSYLNNGQAKLEFGNKPTDWSPAPEDMATVTDYANLEIKVNGIQGTVANKADKSQVTQLADQITSVVSDVSNIQVGGRNLIVRTGELPNTMINPDGVPGAFKGSALMANPIAVKAGENLILSRYGENAGTGVDNYFRFGFYDDNDAVILRQVKNDKSFAVTVPTGATKLKVSYPSGTDVKAERGNKPTDWSPAPEDMATQSQITQMKGDINLRVQKNDVVNQINIDGSGVLIAGQKVHITGQTTIDNAVIKDAMIANLSASKLTAGTIDAGKINVVNLNASNITTGTITGSNLSINLNTGEILFTKGSIKSTDGLLNINVNNGSFSQTNASGDGIYFMSGELNLIDKNFTWPDLNSDHTYGTIDNFGVNMFDQQSVRSMRILGTKGVHLETGKTGGSLFLGMLGSSGTGADFDTNHSAIYSSGRSYIAAGNSRGKLPAQAMVQVGVPLTYPGSKLDWAINPNSDGYDSGKDIILESDTILLQADKEHVSSFAVASDKRSGYLMSTTAYNRSYSSGQTATITQNGVFGVIVSAAKYKLAISDVNNLSGQAHSFLSVKPKQWFDKTETEEAADELTEGYNGTVDSPQLLPHYGYIAEDIYSAGLDNVTFRDPDTGELQGIQYDRLIIYLHQLTKELYQRVNDLEAKIYLMEANK